MLTKGRKDRIVQLHPSIIFPYRFSITYPTMLKRDTTLVVISLQRWMREEISTTNILLADIIYSIKASRLRHTLNTRNAKFHLGGTSNGICVTMNTLGQREILFKSVSLSLFFLFLFFSLGCWEKFWEEPSA